MVIAGVRPNIVLAATVVVTALAGWGNGMAWAFLAGTTANLLGFEPLGLVPLALLVASALVAGVGRVFGRVTWLIALVGAVASLAYDAVVLGTLTLLGTGVATTDPAVVLVPAALLNAALTTVVFLLAWLVRRQIAAQEIAADAPR
ncbi:MAG: hypothetical protein M3295_03560 [Chloroflexota bacterium]|nr:hypothetical protein [Chloroflexota bacterium]